MISKKIITNMLVLLLALMTKYVKKVKVNLKSIVYLKSTFYLPIKCSEKSK